MAGMSAIGGMFEAPFTPEGKVASLKFARLVDDGAWTVLEGVRDTGVTVGGRVISLYDYHRRGGQRWTILEVVVDGTSTTKVVAVNWHALTVEEICTRNHAPSTRRGSQFLTVSGWLWILSEYDSPVRWDGERLVPIGWPGTTPGLTAAGPNEGVDHIEQAAAKYETTPDELNRGAVRSRGLGDVPSPTADGAETVWRRGYARTFLNDLGQESPPCEVVYASGTNPPDVDGGRKVARVSGGPGPAHARGQRLWVTRNVAGLTDPTAAPLQLLEEIQHAGAFDYFDHTPDGELALELVEEDLGAPPTGAYAAAVHNGQTWLVGRENRSRVYYSTASGGGGLVEQFGLFAYLDVGGPDSGNVTALVPTQRALFVLKTRGVYAILGDPAGGYRWVAISERHGTTAPRGWAIVPAVGLVFLDSTAGPCALVGDVNDQVPTKIEPLAGVARTWRRYASEDQAGARVLYDPSVGEVWWHVCEGGSIDPTLGLVLHLEAGGWSLRPGWEIGALGRFGDRVLVGYVDDGGDDRLGIMTEAETTGPDGAEIELELWTGAVEHHQAERTITGEILCDAIGTSGLALATRPNRQTEIVDHAELGTKEQVPSEHDAALWGDALWSTTALWEDIEPIRLPIDLHGRIAMHTVQVRIRAARTRLYAMRLLVDPDTSPVHRREPTGGSLP